MCYKARVMPGRHDPYSTRVMAPDLVGQTLGAVVLDKRPQAWAVGAVATACQAVGKHLLVTLAAPGEAHPRTLRVHLGMHGSWHRYHPGERWQRAPLGARVELHTPRWVFVCFEPKEVDVAQRHAPRPDGVAHLGPMCWARRSTSRRSSRARAAPATRTPRSATSC